MAAFDELLRRLAEAEARFVVIGGLALGARGVVRGTKDIDVVVDLEPDNLKRVAEVAVAAGGHVQRGGALLGSAPTIAAEIASGEQVAIETTWGTSTWSKDSRECRAMKSCSPAPARPRFWASRSPSARARTCVR